MKKTFKFRILFIALFVFPASLLAQAIKGKITDANTGEAVANANVYLDGTFEGTVTDAQGNFSISNTSKSNNPIVISHISYQLQKLANYTAESLNIRLKPKIIMLKEVAVSFDEFSRAKAMRIFLKEFLGGNSSNCIISNPNDIFFRYNKKEDLLTAMADKPLLIINKTLGYKITYFLTEFNYRPLKTHYNGNYFFEEDTTGLKPVAKRRIMAARDDVYYGSRIHFIRSLWADDLQKNKFQIYKTLKGVLDYSKQYTLEAANMLWPDKIIDNIDGRKYVMIGKAVDANDKKFEGNEIYITYDKKQASFMLQTDGNEGTIINRNGYFADGFEWKGKLGVARVSKLLPFEFMPE